MREASGDIWTYEPADAIVIPTNGELVGNPGHRRAVMGAGVALDCKRKIPGIERYLGLHIEQLGNKTFVLCNMMRDGHNGKGPYIVAFPTKRLAHDRSDLSLIVQSAQTLVWHANANGWLSVVMPRVGAGLGRLTWDDVKRVLSPILDDRFIALEHDPHTQS